MELIYVGIGLILALMIFKAGMMVQSNAVKMLEEELLKRKNEVREYKNKYEKLYLKVLQRSYAEKKEEF